VVVGRDEKGEANANGESVEVGDGEEKQVEKEAGAEVVR